jgi:malate dehydrogenase
MKTTILGQGHLMLSVASAICQSNAVTEVALIDEHRSIPRNALCDMREANAFSGCDTTLSLSADVVNLSGAGVVILLPPPSRTLLRSPQANRTANAALIRHFTKSIQQYAPTARVLVAIPPANSLSLSVHDGLEADTGQVIGLSSGLASAYLKEQISAELEVSVKDVTALIIGSDDTIYPLPQYCRVNGIPIDQLLNPEQLRTLTTRVNERYRRLTHAEIPYTLSAWISQIVTAIALDRKRVMSVGTLIRGGTSAVYLSLPAKIGANGVEKIIQLDLTAEQQTQFTHLVTKSIAAQRGI